MIDWILNVFFMIYHRMSMRFALFFSNLLNYIRFQVFMRPLYVISSTICDNLTIKNAFSNWTEAVTTRIICKSTSFFVFIIHPSLSFLKYRECIIQTYQSCRKIKLILLVTGYFLGRLYKNGFCPTLRQDNGPLSRLTHCPRIGSPGTMKNSIVIVLGLSILGQWKTELPI